MEDERGRKLLRLPEYDYSTPGGYFVTIVTQHRLCLFGDALDDQPMPNPAGAMIRRWWDELPAKFPSVDLDEFIVMPNHVHGVIILNAADDGEHSAAAVATDEGGHVGPPLHQGNPSLSAVVQWFKTMTTNEYIHGVRELGWAPFPGRLWQRNYYEHVVRSQRDLDAIRKYIQENPGFWPQDEENPARP
jgi:REP-associated tyrosine transposase